MSEVTYNSMWALGQCHPLTCGGNRGDEAHREYQSLHGGDLGELVKTETGLACPACGWKQPMSVSQQLENALSEIEKLNKILEQSTKGLSIQGNSGRILRMSSKGWDEVGNEWDDPDLFEYIKGK